ncbi:DUF4349 domain-containing protein [Undibacterium sp. Ji22W]|uniref:DUF4349 domain-containing protein n=1 Tax=Undibacterium sp. Ji22W TaxID=3413038 RepID=UPI003BF2222B
MKRYLSLLCMVLAIVACSKPELAADMSSGLTPKSASQTARYLAYQRIIYLETEEHKVAGVFAAMIAACRDTPASPCTVMESKLNSGRSVFATIKFRAKPEGIQQLMSALRQQGAVVDQSTTAEDLAAPIEDSAKKLAMLLDYRGKLEALRLRASNDVDALIKVNRELAQVQSELEEMEAKKAHLMQRVETELLTVTITAQGQGGFWKPVRLAISDFGLNLSQGVSMTITACAYLVPWLLMLALLVWGIRKVWRRRTPRG